MATDAELRFHFEYILIDWLDRNHRTDLPVDSLQKETKSC